MNYFDSMKQDLEKFHDFLLNEKGLAKSSADAYMTHMLYLYTESGSNILQTCEKYSQVADLIKRVKLKRAGKKQDHWTDNMASKTADMATVFFTWAAREGIIKNNPMQFGHEFSKGKPKLPRYFKDTETIRQIFEHPKNTKSDKTIFRLLFSSGIRAGELCSLNLDSIDLERRIGTLLEAKGGQYRTFYIDEQTVECLKEHLEIRKRQGGVALFVNRNGDRLKRDTLTKFVIRRGKQIGIEMSPHMFRHTVGRNMRRKGARLEDIADVLGHKSLSSSRIYAMLEAEEVRNIRDRYAEAIA